MKKIWIMMSALVIIGGIVGCSNASNNGDAGADASFDDIYDDIKEKVADDIDDGIEGYVDIDLLEEDADDPAADIYQETMQLEADELENGKVFGTLINVNADEIILIEAADEADVDSITAALEKQLENEHQVWETYLPDQFEKVENNIITSHGNFILYVTYEDPEAIEDIFDSHFE